MEDLLVDEEALDVHSVDAEGTDVAVGAEVDEGAADGKDKRFHTRAFDDLELSRPWKNR